MSDMVVFMKDGRKHELSMDTIDLSDKYSSPAYIVIHWGSFDHDIVITPEPITGIVKSLATTSPSRSEE
jgi:hypothetical protein